MFSCTDYYLNILWETRDWRNEDLDGYAMGNTKLLLFQLFEISIETHIHPRQNQIYVHISTHTHLPNRCLQHNCCKLYYIINVKWFISLFHYNLFQSQMNFKCNTKWTCYVAVGYGKGWDAACKYIGLTA